MPLTNEAPVIAVIEDDSILGESITQRLTLEGYRWRWWRTGQDALACLSESGGVHAIVCDIKLPDIDGEDLFHQVLPAIGTVPIVFMTAFGDIKQAVRLVRAGADDYLTKPFAIDALLQKLATLLARHVAKDGSQAVLGTSEAMRQLEGVLRRIKDIDSSVILMGESGVGKEVAAKFLHDMSNRRDAPFIAVNCAAIPDELMDSELFGHEKGSFTSAHALHVGFAERARDGTLFLDEVAELHFGLQAKLLRLLQEHLFFRVGGERQIAFRARLVCATNADLGCRVEQGSFRRDLYYRLNVIELRVPPLRERSEDIMPLLQMFVTSYAEKFKHPVKGITSRAENAILAHQWPGNVRELRNRTERAVALAEGARLDVGDLFPEVGPQPREAKSIVTLAEARAEAERHQIISALDGAGGRVGAAAKRLRVSRTTLWEKMKRLGIAEHITESERTVD
jgi:DNA-binding NtrC family response regulator